jgi:hypothetical protein
MASRLYSGSNSLCVTEPTLSERYHPHWRSVGEECWYRAGDAREHCQIGVLTATCARWRGRVRHEHGIHEHSDQSLKQALCMFARRDTQHDAQTTVGLRRDPDSNAPEVVPSEETLMLLVNRQSASECDCVCVASRFHIEWHPRDHGDGLPLAALRALAAQALSLGDYEGIVTEAMICADDGRPCHLLPELCRQFARSGARAAAELGMGAASDPDTVSWMLRSEISELAVKASVAELAAHARYLTRLAHYSLRAGIALSLVLDIRDPRTELWRGYQTAAVCGAQLVRVSVSTLEAATQRKRLHEVLEALLLSDKEPVPALAVCAPALGEMLSELRIANEAQLLVCRRTQEICSDVEIDHVGRIIRPVSPVQVHRGRANLNEGHR